MNYSRSIGALCALAAWSLSMVSTSLAADELRENILTLRERAVIEDRVLTERLDTLVPELMRRENIDA